MRTILAMAFVATTVTVSAQPICTRTIEVEMPCELRSSEIHPWPGPEQFWWEDGTTLSTAPEGLTVPPLTRDVALVLGGRPMSFRITTERRVRFVTTAGGTCVGVSTRGWEDPGTIEVQGDSYSVNAPVLWCDEPSRDTLCMRAKVLGVGPEFPSAPYPLTRVAHLCVEVLP